MRLLLLICAGIVSAVRADPPKNLPKELPKELRLDALTYPEQLEYARCRRAVDETKLCGNLAARVCQTPTNLRHPDCIFREYELCAAREFNPAGCREKLRIYCDTGGDELEVRCDQLRFEDCLGTEFETPKCKLASTQLILPIIRHARDDRSRAPENLPHRMDPATGAPVDQMSEILCRLSGEDRTHPYRAFCSGAPVETTFESASRRYRTLKRDAKPWPEKIGTLAEIYEDLLRASPEDNLWQMGLAQEVFGITEILASRGNSAAHTRFGGDGLVTNFMLLRAFRTPQLRAIAADGLAHRLYPSEFLTAALLQATADPDPRVRESGWRGVGLRWNSRARAALGGFPGVLNLSGLMDCQNYVAPSPSRPTLQSLREAMTVDLSDPSMLCRFGDGADVSHLQSELIENYIHALLESPENAAAEKAAILDGHTALSVYGRNFSPEVTAFAQRRLSDTSTPLAIASLRYLKARSLSAGTEEARLSFADEISENFSVLLKRSLSVTTPERLREYLRTFADLGLFTLDAYESRPRARKIIALIRDRCAARRDLEWQVRLDCYGAVSDSLLLRSFADAIRNDVLRNLAAKSGADLYSRKSQSLAVLAGKYFSQARSDTDSTLDCPAVLEVSRAIVRETEVLLADEKVLQRFAPLLGPFLEAIDGQTEIANAECRLVARELKSFQSHLAQSGLPERVNFWMDTHQPRIPFGEVFGKNQAETLIQKETFRDGEGLLHEAYVESKTLTTLLDGELRKRDTTGIILQAFAPSALKQWYRQFRHPDFTSQSDFDEEAEFWGISVRQPR